MCVCVCVCVDVRCHFVSRVGVVEPVAVNEDVARRHDEHGVGARPLVQRRRRSDDGVPAQHVVAELQSLALAALRQPQRRHVQAGVVLELIRFHLAPTNNTELSTPPLPHSALLQFRRRRDLNTALFQSSYSST